MNLEFWDNIVQKGANECWLWSGTSVTGKYAKARFNGKNDWVHRHVYRFHHGEFSGVVRHTCDVPLCCNPKHLVNGTQADNMADMVKRGRSAKGEDASQAKLTETDVQLIRLFKRLDSRLTLKELGAVFGVSFRTIHQILKGQTWKHLTELRLV